MTSPQMAQLSTLALYAAMGVLAFAMLAFTLYLARLAPKRSATRRADRSPVLVGAGGAEVETLDGRSAGRGDVQDATGGADSSEVSSKRAGGAAGSAGLMLSWLAAMLLVASIALRGFAVMRPPVANLFEFAVAGATATLVTYLVLAQRRPLRWLGLFVVLPVLCVLGLALVSWYVPAAELAPALDDYWIAIHVPIAIISIGIFTVAFSVLMIQLLVERRERGLAEVERGGGAAPAGSLLDELPSAARLDRLAYSLHVAAFPLWTFTIIAGAIWGQKAWGTYWSWDPKEIWSFVIWVLYAAYLHARATSGWKRRTANLIAVAGYVAILLNTTVVNLFSSGLHSYSGL
ncbi:c-type cytochrome biogenesis protein CcsB [Mobilicoccus caccae]|uniref:C-type cytochrome biogenesis protein CcsB n=1 Tax=Mobilicoccus caccae TaxID=1859295 RepID=A0ABQ6IMW8_9MICO|nr:c-type cytochrome biogenesis protein CcsB [Mobilicoccus caccae]GMA38446.1 c-type cytochrome biogenesis protein CcsB [Mobilicoccus caccae]